MYKLKFVIKKCKKNMVGRESNRVPCDLHAALTIRPHTCNSQFTIKTLYKTIPKYPQNSNIVIILKISISQNKLIRNY